MSEYIKEIYKEISSLKRYYTELSIRIEVLEHKLKIGIHEDGDEDEEYSLTKTSCTEAYVELMNKFKSVETTIQKMEYVANSFEAMQNNLGMCIPRMENRLKKIEDMKSLNNWEERLKRLEDYFWRNTDFKEVSDNARISCETLEALKNKIKEVNVIEEIIDRLEELKDK